jgi:hypothetical protein
MGAWGGGLYESDFGSGLRADIGGLMRAPLSDDELLARIAETHLPGGEDDHVDSFDYWLVLADQLERRGLHRGEVFDRAIRIIEGGEDIAALARLDAEPGTIARRRKDTAELLERLRNPRPAKPRRALRKPQPLLFEVGEALIWPTDRGNPYSEILPIDRSEFRPDGWGFGIITDAGHEYGAFAYYALQVLMWRRPERPSVELAAHCPRSDHYYGAVGKSALEKLRVERLGKVPPEALGPAPDRRSSSKSGLEFGLDAFNRQCWNFLKFPHPAPSGAPLDPEEPDQRPGFEEYLERHWG